MSFIPTPHLFQSCLSLSSIGSSSKVQLQSDHLSQSLLPSLYRGCCHRGSALGYSWLPAGTVGVLQSILHASACVVKCKSKRASLQVRTLYHLPRLSQQPPILWWPTRPSVIWLLLPTTSSTFILPCFSSFPAWGFSSTLLLLPAVLLLSLVAWLTSFGHSWEMGLSQGHLLYLP